MNEKQPLSLVLCSLLACLAVICTTNERALAQARLIHANIGHIEIDGDAGEWPSVNMYDPDPLVIPSGADQMGISMHFAWDGDFFYLLIRETGNAPEAMEAEAVSDYTTLTDDTAPWFYDGVAFWMDLDNSNDREFDFNLWLGFSSTGQTGLIAARVNNVPEVLENRTLQHAQSATAGSFVEHNRLIEARIKWTDLQAWVDPDRLPTSGLGHMGYSFGCEPMIAENGYRKQRFIGGSTLPSGADENSIDITNCGFIPVELSSFTVD